MSGAATGAVALFYFFGGIGAGLGLANDRVLPCIIGGGWIVAGNLFFLTARRRHRE